jgi:NTP pyrophosphatase (non-canonical NTP hydrolase)
MALSVEVAELVEHMQWLTEDQSKALPDETLASVSEELADILIYLVRLSDKLGVDLLDAAAKKMTHNAEKYPVEHAKGNARKYTDFPEGETLS